MIDIGHVARARIDIRIGTQPLMHLPAEQLVDWLSRRFSDNVPARHFERAQHTHQRQIGMLGKSARINAPPQRFDVMRIVARRIARKHILDHLCNEMRLERHAISLANARNPACRCQLDEHEIASAEMRRGIADDERFDIGKFHAG